jgi:iron complex transport system substrate-binding protein
MEVKKMRIVSICPSNTELLAYLDLTSSIVGVDNYSDWPPEVNQLPRLGPDLDINMDEVEKLKPDLVLASLSVPGMEKNIERLEERNLPYIVLNPNSLSEIGENLLRLGQATGTLAKAEQVHSRYLAIIEQYRKLASKITKPTTLYWEWWAKPVFTPGGVNWLTEISSLAGGHNVFADEPVASVQTNWDDVRERNPEHICLVWVGVHQDRINPNTLNKRPGWDQIEAMKKKQVYVLEEPLFCRPSPRLLAGLAKIASLLHPEMYPTYINESDNTINGK